MGGRGKAEGVGGGVARRKEKSQIGYVRNSVSRLPSLEIPP